MSVYNLITFITGLLFVCFALLVYFQNRRGFTNRIFGAVSLSFAIWIFSWFFMLIAKSEETAIVWAKELNFGATLIPIFYLHWIFSIIDINKKRKEILFIGYILTVILVIFNFSNNFIIGVHSIKSFVYWPTPGSYYKYFLILGYGLMVGYGFFELIKSLYVLKGFRKNQVIYIIIGSIFGFGGGAINFPAMYSASYVTNELEFIGALFVLVSPIAFAYAAYKYRLMDVRLVISKSVLYFVLTLSVASIFTFISLTSAIFLENSGGIWTTLVVSFMIVLVIDPLKKLLGKLTDKFFYKGKIEYQDVLRQVSLVLSRELDLDILLKEVSANLEKLLKLTKVNLLITTSNHITEFHSLDPEVELKLQSGGALVDYLKQHNEIVVADELSRRISETRDASKAKELENVQHRMDELKTALAMPIYLENKLTGVMLVQGKLSGGTFTQEDLDFFNVFGPQIATALEKSKLFEEVQKAKIDLEKIVAQRTADLKERNQYLVALQTITNVITTSLDFQKVMQTIADGISSELGFIGGMLNFIDGNNIKIGAISNTPITRQAISLLPADPRTYRVSLQVQENLAIKSIITRQIVSGPRFYDFIKPALTEAVADKIQGALKAQSVFAVPVYTEEKVIGTIDYVLAKPAEAVTDVEKEMMKSLADQVGIVFRNLSLYEKIQSANEELKQANVRLTNLDKAKSEFLSIASHQLRTPLTGIKGYLSMILEGDFGDTTPKVRKVIEDVFTSSDRMARLVNIFLNVSKIESGKFDINKKSVSLIEIINQVINTLKLEADSKGLALNFEKPKKLLPNLMLDDDKIKDVVGNLVDNAVKYTPKGKIDITVEEIGRAVQVKVKDTGIGIKTGEDKELFNKFVRGEGVAQINTGGSGLGLYIAKKIVEGHGGKIWAESAGQGMGSSFIFTLPTE